MKTTLNGYGENAATFAFDGIVCKGQPVTMKTNMTVKPCAAEEAFIGCLLNSKGEFACVQLDGYVQFDYSGATPELGVCNLAADGNGGVCVSASGREYVVTDVDDTNKKVGIIL